MFIIIKNLIPELIDKILLETVSDKESIIKRVSFLCWYLSELSCGINFNISSERVSMASFLLLWDLEFKLNIVSDKEYLGKIKI